MQKKASNGANLKLNFHPQNEILRANQINLLNSLNYELFYLYYFQLLLLLMSKVIIHSTALLRIVLYQVNTLGIAVIRWLTKVTIVFSISITELFLFSLCGRQFCCMLLSPFRPSILLDRN